MSELERQLSKSLQALARQYEQEQQRQAELVAGLQAARGGLQEDRGRTERALALRTRHRDRSRADDQGWSR